MTSGPFKSEFCREGTKNLRPLAQAGHLRKERCEKTTMKVNNGPLRFFTGVQMSRILILYAHSAPHRSRVNRRMIAAAASLPGVTVSELYELYPDFVIDVEREQSLLAQADLVVMQHPIQWYGMPSLQKEWLDQVLEHGWAYGSAGHALAGKHFLLAVTTGGTPQAYSGHGEHGYPFSVFLPPYRQTAALCGMRWVEPLVMHGARQADEAAVAAHVEAYRSLLAGFPDSVAQRTDAGRVRPG